MAHTYDSKGIHGAELLVTLTEIAKKIRTDDEVVAAALNNLNSRLEAIESIENWGDIVADSINLNEFPLIAGDPTVMVGTSAPSTAPSFSGQLYVDTTNKVLYVATGYSTSSDWTNVSVAKKLGTATVGSTTKPIYLSSGTPTEASTYAGGTKVTLNGTAKGATDASFYAPTASGTANQVLISGGSNTAPTWTNQSNIAAGTATTAQNYDTSTGTIKTALAGKADKVTGTFTTGDFASLDANGNIQDSGSKASDFAAASHTHGNITSDGKVGTMADRSLVTTTGGAVTAVSMKYDSPSKGNSPAVEFIATVSQDTKGQISATKQEIRAASTSQTGIVQLTDSHTSTSTTTAATPKNVKEAYDLAAGKQDPITFNGTYNASTNPAATVATVTGAVNDLDSEKTSTDGTNVQVKVKQVDGKINAVSITTDNTENKNNKVTSVRTTSSATDTAYPSEKAVASALSEKASKQVRLSFTLVAAPSGGVSTKYVKIYAAGSDYRHWECSYNGTTGSLYAAWLFRSYYSGENSRDNVTLLKSIDTVTRAWYSVGASTWYVKFEHASTTSQQMTFNVAALDTSALPTLEAVDTLPSGATELTVNGVTMAEKLVTARQLAVDLSNTSTNTSFNGTANVTNIKVSGQLADTNIASASNWNAKEDASNKVTTVRAYSSASDTNYPSEKAVAAAIETTVGDYRTKPQDISKGANLVVNGSGRMASNYNFSTCTYIPELCNRGSAGSFAFSGTRACNEYISVDFNKTILFSADIKNLVTQPSGCTHRVYVDEFDIDKRNIQAIHVMYGVGTLTKLAQDLVAGDTVVHFEDLSNTNWKSTTNYHHGFIFWNYTNSYGYTYPPETYSRNVYPSSDNSYLWSSPDDVNTTNNTITLTNAWSGPTIPAGTYVSRRNSGNTYPYPASGSFTDTEWHTITGTMTGIAAPGTSERSTKFSQGTAFIKVGVLPTTLNNTDPTYNARAIFTNLFVYEAAAQSSAATKLTTARQLAVDLANTSTTTTFDGSANVTNIKVSGTLPIANGGTGATTAKAAEYAISGGIAQATATLQDNYHMVFSQVGDACNPTNGVFLYRTTSTVWNYMKGKMSSDSGVNISGSASSATSATNVNITGSVKTTSTTNGDTIQMQAGTGTAGEVTIVNSKHSASSAKLDSAKELAVSLSNTSTTTTFDGSAAVTNIKVSGTLPVANGGTGATTAANARTNLDVYSKSETDSLLNGKVEVVTALPATGTSGVIYYVGPTGSGSDQYEEYIWDSTNSQFIKVGDKSVDLSNYVNTLSTSGTGSVVTSISKSGNTLSATIGNIAIDNLSDWASSTDVTVSSVTYHTYWPVAPTSSNQVYGISIKDGKLYQVYNNKGTYSVRPYDRDTTYTNASLGQGYGTCSSAESTAEKAVTLGSYAQTAGGIVAVKFTNAICAAATLKINGTTAKPIYIKGAAVTASNKGAIAAGDTAYFMYDGSYYHFLGTDRAATNPIVNITRSGTTFTATRLDGSSFTFTQQDNNTTYTQEKLGQGYATCTTAAATAAKEASLTNYELANGGVVAVKFTNALCADATLAINGQAAKYIFINGAKVTATSAKEVLAGDLAFFMYDGTQYQFICTDRISKEGITGLSVSGKTITYTKADGTTGTITTQDTTYTFDGTYNASTNKAATVSTVTNAVNALDVDDITGFGAGKTLATLTETDGKIAATFQNISITSSQISDKTDSYSASGTVAVTGKAVAAALGTLDYDEVGGDGKYISKIKETDGKISATVTTMDTTPTASSTKAVTSGGIYNALEGKVSIAGDTMTGRLTLEKPLSQIITGTGIAATSSGSPTTYYPARWKYDLGIANPTPGDKLVIQIPCAGHDYGVFISTDNGTTYYPVARHVGSTRLTTHYPAGAYICVVFEGYTSGNNNAGRVDSVYPAAGATARVNYNNGCWRIINDYDSDNTYDRIYNANGRFYAGSTGCSSYSLVCLDSEGKFSKLVSSGTGTGTTKTINTAGKFKLDAVIYYYNADNSVAANTLVTSTYATYVDFPNLDTRYSHNHTTTFTTNSPLYIECTIDDDGYWSPTEKCITQSLEAGYYYIYLGQTYSTEYQLSLVPSHPLYYYDGINLTEKPRLSKTDSDRIDAIAEELDNKVDVDDLDFTGNATQENDRLIFEDIIFDSIYPTLGKYGLATFPETTAVDATEFSGDKEWLLDWRPYLVDMSPVVGETAKVPVVELQKDNWLRTVNGDYAPVCGITSTQAAALNGKKDTLYWKTGSAGDKVSVTVPSAFDASGNFVPVAFWEYVKGNLAAVNTAAGATYAAPIEVKVYVASQAYAFGAYTDYHIPAPWETTETKYSVFIGRKTDVYVVDGYSATTGEHMRGLCSKPLPVGTNQFDPEYFRLRRTGISPGPSTVVGSRIRNFFYNYVVAASANCTVKGGAGTLSILYDNGTYPATNGPNQYRCTDWSRGCNAGGSAGNAVPVGEMGYHSLNAFLCSLEAAYGTRNLWSPTAFSSGNSANDACGTAAQYRTNGGFWVKVGSGGVNYMTYAGNMKTAIGASSDAYVYNVVNGQYAHFQCMEPQIAASLAVEIGIGASTGAGNNEFTWNGGKWHYELPSITGVVGLGSGAMNCRIYKEVEFSGKTIASIANCSGGTMLRCALAEGVNPVGDIWCYYGGGAELVYVTDGTGNTNYKYSFYLEPDQTKWAATDTTEKVTSGTFAFEGNYAKLIEDSTAGTLGNAYCLARTGYTPVRRLNGGAVYTGECCYQYRSIDDDAKGSTGIRSRRCLRFRGYATYTSCSPRYLTASYRPSYAYVTYGCSAQVLLA